MNDFNALYELAYREDNFRGLAVQMSEALGLSKQHGEKSCDRWLKGKPVPAEIMERTRDKALERYRDLSILF